MSADDALGALADLCGIVPEYHDFDGVARRTSPDTQRALLRANGLFVETDAIVHETLADLVAQRERRMFPTEIVIESGDSQGLGFGGGFAWQLTETATGRIVAEGQGRDGIALPPLPSGIYRLGITVGGGAETVTVLAAPRRLPQIRDICGTKRLWGLNAALYGLKSDRNSGMGDLDDLSRLCEIGARAGAGFLGINPVHALGFGDRTTISPYSPSHRGFLNTSHIALDRIPGLHGAVEVAELLAQIEPEMASLRAAVLVQYSAHKALHAHALEQLYRIFLRLAKPETAAFDTWRTAQGDALTEFARFEAQSETDGPDWRTWPQDRTAPSDDRQRFHCWLQWVADCQIADAQRHAKASGMALGLYLDLAVGPRRGGAESWCERDSIASGVSIGAPPDHLSPGGQNWDLAAFAPRKLLAQGYGAFRRILAQTMRHAGLLRIDHVLGLNRSFWIPDDGSPGAYIRQPFDALIAVIKIEAERAGTAIVGEDLGLVPDGFRDRMRREGFYGYSVLQYEREPDGRFRDPAGYDPQVLACFGTHDTPTLGGYCAGRDIEWWHRLGWIDEAGHAASQKTRVADVAALARLGPGSDDTPDAAHDALAGSPAALVSVQLDDVLGQKDAQNLPGTIDQHPNWRRKYSLSLDALDPGAALTAISRCMQSRRCTTAPTVPQEV